MFKIVRFPSKLNTFFSSLKTEFLFGHFEYFKMLVLLIAFVWERRNVASMHRYVDPEVFPHRTRFNNFLTVGRWKPERALAMKAYELLHALKPQEGETLYLVIDDSKKGKRGKKMEAAGWVYDPLTRKPIWGHQYAKATILFRGYTIPFGIRLYVKKEKSGELGMQFQKTTQLAAELIKVFLAPTGVRVVVLFDSFYLCSLVVQACRERGFHFVSALASNRNLYNKDGKKLKAGTYGKELIKKKRQRLFTISKGKTKAVYRYVDAGWIRVGKLGKLHLVYSRKNREPKPLGLVSDDPALCAKKIIASYDARWSIEVFFKDVKQLLGFGQYQNRAYKAAVTHLHLVCFAYALLTHLAIERNGAQEKRNKAANVSVRDLQHSLRRIVWEDTSEYVKSRFSDNLVFKELLRLIVAT